MAGYHLLFSFPWNATPAFCLSLSFLCPSGIIRNPGSVEKLTARELLSVPLALFPPLLICFYLVVVFSSLLCLFPSSLIIVSYADGS